MKNKWFADIPKLFGSVFILQLPANTQNKVCAPADGGCNNVQNGESLKPKSTAVPGG